MIVSDIYTSIGPFKGVPEDARARIASAANSSLSKSAAAAEREATDNGDDAEGVLVYQGSEALSMLGERISSANSDYKNGGWCAAAAAIFMSGGYVLLMTVFLRGWLIGKASFGEFAACAFTMTALIVGVWAFAWFDGVRNLRDIRKQGFVGDLVPEAAARFTGECWLLGEDAMQIVTAEDLRPEVTTVFYDAIGTVRTHVNRDGIETVVVKGRDGTVLSELSAPEAEEFRSSRDIAAYILSRSAASRKAD